jgi:ribosomal protein L29
MLSTRAPFQAAAVSRTTVRGARLIVQVRPTKAADFRGLDNAEILQKVDELKKEKLRLQYMQRTRGNMLNPGSVSDATWLLCCLTAPAAVVAAALATQGPACCISTIDGFRTSKTLTFNFLYVLYYSGVQENNPDAVQVKPHEFQHVRRQIAQLETVLRERELADGITRKQSRKLRKEVQVAAGFGNL